MTVGTSIFLVVVGAILSYAITWELPAIDVAAVGVILMLAGVLGLAISLAWAFHPNRRSESQDRAGRRLGQDRDGLAAFGEPPPSPHWDAYVPPTTYSVPFDGHQDQAYAAVPAAVPATGAGTAAPPVAPWYGSDAAGQTYLPPFVPTDSNDAVDPEAATGPQAWWPRPSS